MNDLSEHGVVFLLPTELSGQRGPVAGWLNTAGWVAAATRLSLEATVITPYGITDPKTLRDRAFQQSLPLRPLNEPRLSLPKPLKVALKDIRELVRARRFDRVVSRTSLVDKQIAFVWQRHELFQRAGRKLADLNRCPLVLFVPAPKVWEARSWGVRRPGWETLVERSGDVAPLREADLVACVSDEVAMAVGSLGVDPSRIIVTPSSVDTDLFRPGVESDVRRRYSLEDKFVIGWAGSFRSFHGLEVLLDAIEKAKSRLPSVIALLVGDGPERARLENDVERRGLRGSVCFVGPVHQTELPSFLGVFDVGVVSARANSSFHYSPLKAWEYMATATPVVAPSIGLFAKLQHRVHAYLIQPGDSTSLSNAIVELASNPSLRLRLARAGRELAEANSWNNQLQHVIERIQSQDVRDRRRGPGRRAGSLKASREKSVKRPSPPKQTK